MISLIKKKSGQEDLLTGEFFEHISYISFQKGMKPILMNTIYPVDIRKEICTIQDTYWHDKALFWERIRESRSTTEIDMLFDLDKYLIGIEIKYLSPLSSDDKPDDNVTALTSMNQLSREARALKIRASGSNKIPILLLLGNEKDSKKIYECSKSKIDSEVFFGYLCWEEIRETIMELQGLSKQEEAIVGDLISLLKYYHFDVFDRFHTEKNVRIYPRRLWNY